MSLVCVVPVMNASEKKSDKKSVKSWDELRKEARPVYEDFQKKGGSSYMQLLETKRNKRTSFDHNAGDIKTSDQK